MYNAYVARQNQQKSPNRQISKTDQPNINSAKILGVKAGGYDPNPSVSNSSYEKPPRLGKNISEILSSNERSYFDEEPELINIFDPSTLKHVEGYENNSHISRALVKGVDTSTHLHNYCFRPRSKTYEIGPKNVFWARKHETDKVKTQNTEEYYRNRLFTKDVNPYIDGSEKQKLFERDLDLSKHSGQPMKLKNTTESQRVFESVKSQSLIDPIPFPRDSMITKPNWKKTRSSKWVSCNSFKIGPNYVSMKNLELNQNCEIRKSSWAVCKSNTSTTDNNQYVNPPMPRQLFRQSDSAQNIDQKHDWHTYTAPNIMGRNDHVSHSLRTSALDLVLQGDASDAIATAIEEQYLLNLPHTKKVYRMSHEDINLKSSQTDRKRTESERPQFQAENYILDAISELPYGELEDPLDSPMGKFGMDPIYANEKFPKKRKVTSPNGEKFQTIDPSRVRPLYEPPIVSRKITHLPEFNKIYANSAVKQHYTAYRRATETQSQFMAKHLAKNIDEETVSIDNDVPKHPWDKPLVLTKIGSGEEFDDSTKRNMRKLDTVQEGNKVEGVAKLKTDNENLQINLAQNNPSARSQHQRKIKSESTFKPKKTEITIIKTEDDVNVNDLVKEINCTGKPVENEIQFNQSKDNFVHMNLKGIEDQSIAETGIKSYKQIFIPPVPRDYKSPISKLPKTGKKRISESSPLANEKDCVKSGKLTSKGALAGIGMYLYQKEILMLPQEQGKINRTINRYFAEEQNPYHIVYK